MQIAIGALLAFPTFGLHVEFDPELFLVLFIPPLLFADGWKTPTREFLEHGREIFGTALALVVVTVVGIGFLIYWLVPGIPLVPAFATGGSAVAHRCGGAVWHCGRRAYSEENHGDFTGRSVDERRIRSGLAQIRRVGSDGYDGVYHWRRDG